MKVALSLLAGVALVAITAMTMGPNTEALTQNHLVRARALDGVIGDADSDLPPFLLDYLANPRSATAIDYAFEQLVPIAMDVQLGDPIPDPIGIETEAKAEQATFDCVFTNRAGTKWCVTVTYTCEDGSVVPGNPTISDCTEGWHLPYTWNVSISATGKVSMSLTTLTIHTTKTVCRYAPECDC